MYRSILTSNASKDRRVYLVHVALERIVQIITERATEVKWKKKSAAFRTDLLHGFVDLLMRLGLKSSYTMFYLEIETHIYITAISYKHYL